MKFPPAATYLSRIANDVASSVIVPNRIAPRLSTLTLRAACVSLPIVVYRMPPRSQFARTRSQVLAAPGGFPATALPVWLGGWLQEPGDVGKEPLSGLCRGRRDGVEGEETVDHPGLAAVPGRHPRGGQAPLTCQGRVLRSD